MRENGPSTELPPANCQSFNSTHWTTVLAASKSEDPRASEALSKLCETYWFPLYAYVRRRGYRFEDAQDMVQEFFSRLLQKDYLRGVDREKGKFRSYLLAAMEHFLAKEWVRSNRQKRGGGCQFVTLDSEAEIRFSSEFSDHWSAETTYDRSWAFTLLEEALTRLKDECTKSGKHHLFEELKGSLSGERLNLPYAELARRLAMSEGAVKVAAHRLRKRYGELLREEIARTVQSPDELEDEIRCLFAALRS